MEGDFYGSAVLKVMKKSSRLEKALPDDVAVEWMYVARSTEAREALGADRLDYGILATAVAINALENGFPISICSNSTLPAIKL
jgi:ABC-type nitrate/sulfonate/bicarbonate transport system substrate-binding protein